MIYKASLKKTPTYRVAGRNHLFQWDTAENKWNSKIYGATHAQETCSWDFHFIFNYKGKIVPYVQQRGARGGLPWQRITTWNLPAPSASAPISTHSPIWPGCSKGAMPRGPARRPAREFLSGQFGAGLRHFSSPPVLRGPGTLWIWPGRFSTLSGKCSGHLPLIAFGTMIFLNPLPSQGQDWSTQDFFWQPKGTCSLAKSCTHRRWE